MGFFSTMINSVTGGWADVTLTIGEAVRGEPVPVMVRVHVKSSKIDISNVYLNIECNEVVDIPHYRAFDNDDHDIDHVHVFTESTLFENTIRIASAQTLEAGGDYEFGTELTLPTEVPGTYRGRHSGIAWRAQAGLDMTGNDPDSGWVDFYVN